MSGNIQQTRTSQLAYAPQNLLKTYSKRLQDDVNAMIENFIEIIKSAKVEQNPQISKINHSFYDIYQIEVRAANIVRAGEALLKLVNELKTFVILNDFPSINQQVKEENESLIEKSKFLESQFLKLKGEFSVALFDLESEHLQFNKKSMTNH